MLENILTIKIDRAGRVVDTQNLSLNQCSTNNTLRVYCEDRYDYVEVAFRKPDGWLSDRITLSQDVDENLKEFYYVPIDKELTSFIMGGRMGILVANIYLHSKIDGVAKVAALGNLRINVNYVDDSQVYTGYSEAYINDINANISKLQSDIVDFKSGSFIVGKASEDNLGNPIVTTYETKADAQNKFETLDSKKLDKDYITDQTNRLESVEENIILTKDRLSDIEGDIEETSTQIKTNSADIKNLKDNSVSQDTLDTKIEERVNAELNLQKQIDNIAASTNVKDVVGSRTELLAYDTTKLESGDRVQVLADSTQSNAPTIYRWTGSEWVYVGRFSTASYSKTEIDAQHNLIKNTIPNKLRASDNTIYLYKDSQLITGQDTSPLKFKTINGTSIFGAGDISTNKVDSELSTTSINPVQNKLITLALRTKADKTAVDELTETVSNKASLEQLGLKQDKLIAGANITITENVISSSTGLKPRKVEELPETGEFGILYLIKVGRGYTEYVWTDDGTFEPLGDAAINLDNYYTKTEIEASLGNKANQSFAESLEDRISTNTATLASKADSKTLNDYIETTNSSITLLRTGKADKSELSEYAKTKDIPDFESKQDTLVSGENIKTINGVNILGAGDLLLSDTTVVDLDNYVLKEDYTIDLSLKADKTELFDKDYTKLTNLPNLDVFATKEELTEEIGKVVETIPEIELNNYYTKAETYNKTEVDNAIQAHTPDLTGYATEEFVTGLGYVTSSEALTVFATKGEIPTIPTDISAFTNDVGYLTEHQSLAGYATEQYVSNEIKDLLGAAPEAYDTLKEIADYISSDKTATQSILTSLSTKAEKASVYTKTETDSKLQTVKNSVSTNTSNISSLSSDVSSYKSSTNSRLTNIETNLGNKILFKNWTV